MAFQQECSRLTDKSRMVQKGAGAGICPRGTAFRHRFSCMIIIPVSSATPGGMLLEFTFPLARSF